MNKNKLNVFVALLLTACLFFVQVTPSFGASVSFQKKTPNLNSVRSVQGTGFIAQRTDKAVLKSWTL